MGDGEGGEGAGAALVSTEFGCDFFPRTFFLKR